MNKIYKIINRVLTERVVVVSELAKRAGHNSITTPPSHADQHFVSTSSLTPHHLKISVRMVASVFLLTALGNIAHAGEIIIYDNDPNKLSPDIWGNSSLFSSNSLTGNTIKVISGTISGSVFGGITDGDQEVSGNSVTVSGGQIKESVFGGYSTLGSVADNKVIISGGEVNGDIIGGVSGSGNAIGNSVIISGGEVHWDVFGGNGAKGNISGNSVTISGGKVYGRVYGGGGAEGNVSGNTVTISGGEFGDDIIGGASDPGNATGNAVIISGTPLFSTNSSIYGGYKISGNGDVSTGNTLNFSAHSVRVNEVANFHYYNFTLTPSMANTGDALIDAQSIQFGNGNGTASTIKVVGIHSGKVLNAGDEFILMQAVDMTGNGDGGTSTGVAQQGISLLYDVQTMVDVDGKVVKATILGNNGLHRKGDGDDNGHVARVNPQLKALWVIFYH